MSHIKLTLIAGRSLKQGAGVSLGKDTEGYQTAVSTLEMSRGDMARLGLEDGHSVRITAAGGQSVAACKAADVPDGLAFIAYGPLSSELMADDTDGTGMPSSKGFEVEVERVS